MENLGKPQMWFETLNYLFVKCTYFWYWYSDLYFTVWTKLEDWMFFICSHIPYSQGINIIIQEGLNENRQCLTIRKVQKVCGVHYVVLFGQEKMQLVWSVIMIYRLWNIYSKKDATFCISPKCLGMTWRHFKLMW